MCILITCFFFINAYIGTKLLFPVIKYMIHRNNKGIYITQLYVVLHKTVNIILYF